MPTERYRLTLEVDDSEGPPPIIRLRHLLKCLLRGYGMKCISVEKVADELAEGIEDEPETATAQAGGEQTRTA